MSRPQLICVSRIQQSRSAVQRVEKEVMAAAALCPLHHILLIRQRPRFSVINPPEKAAITHMGAACFRADDPAGAATPGFAKSVMAP